MLKSALALAACLALAGTLVGAPKTKAKAPTPTPKEAPVGIHQFTVKDISGKPVSLEAYKGKALLVVNVASECGYTSQYKGLEELYQRYKDKGFMVLGFPSNDFGGQEPGTEAEIKQFCERNFGVSFDLFAKVNAKSEPQEPLYKYLTSEAGFDGKISWNFNKFLVGKDGKVLARWGSNTKPLDKDLIAALEKAL
jgi:glutathione peroxidase